MQSAIPSFKANWIVISEAAMLGSIGVVVGMKDTRKAEEWRGVNTHEFVSSRRPASVQTLIPRPARVACNKWSMIWPALLSMLLPVTVA